MAFNTPTDIANLACVALGSPRIGSLSENSKQANELNAIYDKIRQEELRAHVWRFATRRAGLRPIVATTKQITFPAYVAATTYQQGDIVVDATANQGNDTT